MQADWRSLTYRHFVGFFNVPVQAPTHTCQVRKVQKREISLFASCKRGRFYAKQFRDLNFVYQHSNSGWNFEKDEIFPPYNDLKLFIWRIPFHHCTWLILYWLSNAFSLQNSIQFTHFKEKMIGRKSGWKRGRFPIPGGRWMFRGEMGSKRGSLPPKEGDLTCMPTQGHPFNGYSEKSPHVNRMAIRRTHSRPMGSLTSRVWLWTITR